MTEDASTDVVKVRLAGPVMVVTLDRPEKRNAVNAAMTAALDAAFQKLEDESDLRVAVLEGAGPVFCAGSDMVDGPGPATQAGGEYGFIRRARSKPVIAAVEGPALGGGLELVLACDLVAASHSATFSLPEATRGRVPNAGGLFRGADRLPRNVALELMVAGGRLSAERAFQLGLVNRLVAPGTALVGALGLALDVCGSAPGSVRAVLHALRRLEAEQEAAGWKATAETIADVSVSAEWAEGNDAFFNRRPPRWSPDRDLLTSWGLV